MLFVFSYKSSLTCTHRHTHTDIERDRELDKHRRYVDTLTMFKPCPSLYVHLLLVILIALFHSNRLFDWAIVWQFAVGGDSWPPPDSQVIWL